MGLVPRSAAAPMTAGVLWYSEEGNVVSVRKANALDLAGAEQAPPSSRTRPSLGPETRARQSPLRQPESLAAAQAVRGGAVDSVSRSGKPTKVGRTGTGAWSNGRLRGSPRVTALGINPERSCVSRQKRKVVMAIVPARKRESRAECSYVGNVAGNRQAASWPRISSHAALQKEWRYE
jgi:hypothetical protein